MRRHKIKYTYIDDSLHLSITDIVKAIAKEFTIHESQLLKRIVDLFIQKHLRKESHLDSCMHTIFPLQDFFVKWLYVDSRIFPAPLRYRELVREICRRADNHHRFTLVSDSQTIYTTKKLIFIPVVNGRIIDRLNCKKRDLDGVIDFD